MSVSLSDRTAVRDAFKACARKPDVPASLVAAPILVSSSSPLTASLVSNAFAYLARFRIARDVLRDMPDAQVRIIDTGWIAERALDAMRKDPRHSHLHARFARMVEHARILVDDYVSGVVTDEDRLANCVQWLASLDLLARIGQFNPAFKPRDETRNELLALCAMFDPVALFAPKETILLNPCFAGMERVGGVDADLVVDRSIVEFKASSVSAISVAHLRQLCVYAVLAEEFGVDAGEGEVLRFQPDRVGLYYARKGKLLMWELGEIFSQASWTEFRRCVVSDLPAVGPLA